MRTVQQGWEGCMAAFLFWVYYLTKGRKSGILWALLDGTLCHYDFETFKRGMKS